ncbi:hypothetical protein BABINDRAFT_160494 [Babjeviella inositovora NRRL Y-12698]|uniref:Pre-mRNA-splicing factor n=1 Tax=Babjeviella inositovora NRRL Y-12698 TaxID=984486 RepID=A0A1E3QTS2_9ASCO|nr:uncharacterized protein BABINDRAFT_160494 [Babjeviella inositovora NRRL Y-12698]ODQ81083.1 hypothetical protein BABINDRAFT_160494 [Babjeviella inositovora NRRL Y-12698]
MIDISSKAKLWNQSSKATAVDSKLVSDIYERITAPDPDAIQLLSSARYLDNYLWRFFHRDATNTHIQSISALIAILGRLPSRLVAEPDKLQEFVLRLLILFNQQLSVLQKTHLITTMHTLLNNIDSMLIRRQIAPLFSISIWGNLPHAPSLVARYGLEEQYEGLLAQLNQADPEKKSEMMIKHSWLYNVLSESMVESEPYSSHLLMFLTAVLSQLPTRQFTNTLVKEMNYLALLKASDQTDSVFIQLLADLEHTMYFPVDDFSGESRNTDALKEEYTQKLHAFQKMVYEHFPELQTLVLCQPSDLTPLYLKENLGAVSLVDLKKICALSEIIIHERFTENKGVILESIAQHYSLVVDVASELQAYPIYPSETSVFELYSTSELAKGVTPVPLLATQYLSTSDFLYRNMRLLSIESRYRMSETLSKTLSRLQLKTMDALGNFKGQSKRIARVTNLTLKNETLPKLLGKSPTVPENIFAELTVDFTKTKSRWEMKTGEMIYLLALDRPIESQYAERNLRLGLKTFRAATIKSVAHQKQQNVKVLNIDIDPVQFSADRGAYKDINYVFRSDSEEDSKIIAELMAIQTGEDTSGLCDWFSSLFLGFSNRMPSPGAARWVKYHSTFASMKDVEESFQDYALVLDSELPSKRQKTGSMPRDIISPPYVLKVSHEEKTVGVQSYVESVLEKKPPTVMRYNAQRKAIVAGSTKGLTLIEGGPGTGKTSTVAPIVYTSFLNNQNHATLIVTKSQRTLNRIFFDLEALGMDGRFVLKIDDGLSAAGKFGSVEYVANSVHRLLAEVQRLAESLQVDGAHGNSCESAGYFYDTHVKPAWQRFLAQLKEREKSPSVVFEEFPFKSFFPEYLATKKGYALSLRIVVECYRKLNDLFDSVANGGVFQTLTSREGRVEYMTNQARVVGVSMDMFLQNQGLLRGSTSNFNSIIIDESTQMSELEHYFVLSLNKNPDALQSIVLLGDTVSQRPSFYSSVVKTTGHLDQSLMSRFIRNGVVSLKFTHQLRARSQISDSYAEVYGGFQARKEVSATNPGFASVSQFIDVGEFNGQGESEPQPEFYQNIGEAEYAVAMYQYMRLIGYPAEKITILTPYVGQVLIIEEILARRCGKRVIQTEATSDFEFDWPTVKTVKGYQDLDNDFVILSLVRTKAMVNEEEYFRSVLTGIGRARTGLYVLGSTQLRSALNQELNLMSIFKSFGPKHRLGLVLGETCNSRKKRGKSCKVTTMDGLEEFGQIVYQMTRERVTEEKDV